MLTLEVALEAQPSVPAVPQVKLTGGGRRLVLGRLATVRVEVGEDVTGDAVQRRRVEAAGMPGEVGLGHRTVGRVDRGGKGRHRLGDHPELTRPDRILGQRRRGAAAPGAAAGR